ncbi:DNA cytosine methyltransferase [uncultured Cytophaga sp.]|mgnify:CR=1 FL=1|uniref:DNA cytosine methyltransferase n=1 Tax=uncultured Cytophaga sp. TaxID=160238 RepID=UPI00262C360A|nr:DNA cytosine methyltransferase [uncultured Cytophaga sp.]
MKKEKKLTFIDLFAGCGGLSEGFLQTKKFNAIAHIEWELPMVNTLRDRLVSHWGHTDEEAKKRVIHFDIQNTEELLEGNWSENSQHLYNVFNDNKIIKNGLNGLINNKKIDVIIGGPPCQAYSIHGRATDRGSMQNDYRNYLFESFVKIVDKVRPEVFVFENVPGILSAKPGGVKITERIYEAFCKIGYIIPEPSELSNVVFDASDFNVPQKRKRVLIIGIKKESKYCLDDFYQSILKNQDKKNKKTVRDAIGFLPRILPLKKVIKVKGKNISHYSEDTNILQHTPRHNNSRDVKIFKKWIEEGMNYLPHKEKVDFYYEMTKKQTLYSKYRNLEWNRQAHTIVAHLQKDGLMFIHPDPEQARSITIREAALLMTFPVDYKFIGSNAYCYKMIGNAVPVNFAKSIGDSIYEVMSRKNKQIK